MLKSQTYLHILSCFSYNKHRHEDEKTYLIFIVPCIVIFYGITNRCHNVQ